MENEPFSDYICITSGKLSGGIHKRIELLASTIGNQPALQFDQEIITYAELEHHANHLASFIQYHSDSSIVATRLCNDINIVPAMLATFKLGRTWLPISYNLPDDTTIDYLQQFDLDKFVVLYDCEKPISDFNVEQYNLNTDLKETTNSISQNTKHHSPDDIAIIISTSGSTGIPKAIPWTHEKLENECIIRSELTCVKPNLISFWGMTFGVNLWTTLTTLCQGGTVHRLNIQQSSIPEIHQYIKKNHINIVTGTPGIFRIVFANVIPSEFQHLKEIRLAGETMLATDFELYKKNFPDSVKITNSIGSTETGFLSSFTADHHTQITTASMPVGRIQPNDLRKITLVDANDRQVINEVGEIHVHAPDLKPYWNSTEENNNRFLPDTDHEGWYTYKTGDLGLLYQNGYLLHLGRIDDQIKINGQRVELAAIQNRLLQHPDIQQVILKPLKNGFETRIIAYYTTLNSQQIELTGLRDFLQKTLPHFMIPTYLIWLDQFPSLPNGKINSNLLPDPLTFNNNSSKLILNPQNDIENHLLEIWKDILGISEISTDDNFFDLGGSSLQATMLISDVNEYYNIVLTPAVLYNNPCIIDLTNVILSGTTTNDLHPALIPFRPYGKNYPIFCFPGSLGNGFSFSNLASLMGRDYPLYGLEMQGIDGQEPLPNTLDELIDYYLDAILSLKLRTPIYLLGMSGGGIHAIEIANRLKGSEIKVKSIIMLDTPFIDQTYKPHVHPEAEIDAQKLQNIRKERKNQIRTHRIRQRKRAENRKQLVEKIHATQLKILLHPFIYRLLSSNYQLYLNQLQSDYQEQQALMKRIRQTKRKKNTSINQLADTVIRTSVKLLEGYEPQLIQDDLIYIKATQEKDDQRDNRWRKLTSGYFEVIELNVPHTMTNYPHVLEVANILKQKIILK